MMAQQEGVSFHIGFLLWNKSMGELLILFEFYGAYLLLPGGPIFIASRGQTDTQSQQLVQFDSAGKVPM